MAGIWVLVILLLCGCSGTELSKWTLVRVLLLKALLLASPQGLVPLIFYGNCWERGESKELLA